MFVIVKWKYVRNSIYFYLNHLQFDTVNNRTNGDNSMIFKTLLTSVAVSMAVASYAQAAIQDGTFEGTANGKNGPVTVAVTIKAGKIANVKEIRRIRHDRRCCDCTYSS